MREHLTRLAIDGKIEDEVLVDCVVIELVMRAVLVEPFGFTGIYIAREDSRSPLVLTGTHFRVPRSWIRGAIKNQIGFGIVGYPSPHAGTADLPGVWGPALHAQILATVLRIIRMEVRPDENVFIWAGVVRPPNDLARLRVERREPAANAEFAPAVSDQHFVLHH